MLNALPEGLSLRPARDSDSAFIASMYRSARPDLQFIDGDEELVASVAEQQFQVLLQGTGEHFPNAMHFIVEKTRTSVGVVMTDFGHNEVRIIFLALRPEVRGLGYGRGVLQGLQQAALQVCSPLTVVVWHNNPAARQLYHQLGFALEAPGVMADKLVWYPQPAPVVR